jgi:hypothetical protein
MKNTGFKVATVFVVVFLAMQLIRFDKTNPSTDKSKEIVAPAEIKNILKNSCFDCHSNETKWPWYADIAPVSWVVTEHVDSARKWVNFSEWESYDEAKKLKLKKLIYREVSHAMPLYGYTLAHPNAALSKADKESIRAWTGVKANDVSMRD